MLLSSKQPELLWHVTNSLKLTIKKIYTSLTNKYGTNDPLRIIKELGIIVQFADLGENKGLYHTLEIEDNIYHCIHINNNLSSNEQRYTLAHELGHYILHQGSNLHFLRRVTKTPLARQEIEADLFASYFMVSDEEIKEINNLTYISEAYKLDYRICEKRLEYII